MRQVSCSTHPDERRLTVVVKSGKCSHSSWLSNLADWDTSCSMDDERLSSFTSCGRSVLLVCYRCSQEGVSESDPCAVSSAECITRHTPFRPQHAVRARAIVRSTCTPSRSVPAADTVAVDQAAVDTEAAGYCDLEGSLAWESAVLVLLVHSSAPAHPADT